DVHPPLYYALLNVVSSFFTGSFSKWFGKGLSIFFLVLTEVFLYKLTVLYIGKKKSAVIPGMIWGIAAGTFFLGSLVRMYAMLCFFCVYTVYAHSKLLMREFRKKDYIRLALSVMLGGLTHYYFYLFLALYCMLYFALLLLRKTDKATIMKYCMSVICGGIAAILVFPFMLQHIFGGYRGDDVKSVFFSLTFNFTGFMKILNKSIFNGYGVWFLLALVICFCVYRKWDKNYVNPKASVPFQLWAVMLLAGVLYALFMMKISISVRSAYISPCYAIIGCSVSIAIIRMLDCMGEEKRFLTLAVIGIALTLIVVPKRLTEQKEKYIPTIQQEQILAQVTGKDCIFAYKVWDNLFTNQIAYLSKADEIYCVETSQLSEDDYPENMTKRRSENELLVFLPNDEDKETYIQTIEMRLNMQAKELISGNFCVYQMQ
ncbi:MAG: hypothetical protein PUB13_08670, partial [Lachnospiraceae bacterium]|nr:hypothetical protein [Lachnospiraceae bacterium]